MGEYSATGSAPGSAPGGVTSVEEALRLLVRFTEAIKFPPSVAIQGVDRDGVVRFWNTTSTEFYGIPEREAVGRPLQELLFLRHKEEEFSASLERVWETGLPSESADCEITTSSGRELWVYSAIFPVFYQGKVLQVFRIEIDTTIRKLEEQVSFSCGANFREFFEKTADSILLLREDRYLDANPAALRLFGYERKSDLVGLTEADLSPQKQPCGRDSAEMALDMHRMANENGTHRFEQINIRRNKGEFWVEKVLTPMAVGSQTFLFVVARDITERKSAEQLLRLTAQVFENSREGILITDKNQIIVSVNKAFSAIMGYSAQDVIGKTPRMLKSGLHDKAYYQEFWSAMQTRDHWEGELWDRRQDGRELPLWQSITAVRDEQDHVSHYFSMFSDITERKEAETKTRYMAEHDFLTGLLCRDLLYDRIRMGIAAATRNGTKLAILFIDLDDFKNINDTMGHHVGDEMLRQIAERLRNNVRGIDTVSRLGGDEFAVMLPDIGKIQQVARIAGNMIQAIAAPCRINGDEDNITASIGISVYPNDGNDGETLIKHADVAMYHAKQHGRNSFRFFSSDMNQRINKRAALEAGLKQALDRNEFFLQYQPALNTRSGQIVGAEALIRWRRPRFGLLLPEDSISISEECGLIIPIGNWVLHTACQQAKVWLDMGYPIVVSVNLSVTQFRQKSLVQSASDALQCAGLDPQYLELEITENILVNATEATFETLNELRAMGIKLALDDYGAGNSSLDSLRRLSIDTLKIDRSLIRDITGIRDKPAVIGAIIAMAKSFKLKVIAEGVETREQYDFLRSQGCDEYQGYYSSRAMSADDFAAFRTSHLSD